MSLHDQYGKDAPKVLSGMMTDQIGKLGLPSRFMLKNGSRDSSMIIYDKVTKRQLELGLCDMHGAVKALKAFCEPVS